MSSGPFGNRPGRQFNPDDIPWEQIALWRRRAMVALVFAVLLFIGTSTVYRIDADSEGVVLRFGEHLKTVSPGLHWKLPWPVDAVYEVPVQEVQFLEFGFETSQAGRVTRYAPASDEDMEVAEMLTADLNLAHVEWIVQYRAKDPEAYLFSIGSTEVIGRASMPSGSDFEVNPAVPDTIADVSESVMRKLVGDYSIDYVLTIGRDQIANEAKQLIQQELDDFNAGVEIDAVKLQSTSPPTAKVQDAFQEVNRARQTKEKVVNEALGEQNSQIPAARGARDQAIAEAEGYGNRVVLETKGKTTAFKVQLAEYEKAPDVTRQRLYLDAMEEVLGQVGSKMIIDDSVQGVLPLLNLDDTAPAGRVKAGKGGVQ